MLMKDGTVVPKSLAEALENDIRALKIFMDMSIVYQRLYVKQAANYGDSSTRSRIETVIREIHKYGEASGGE